MTFVGHRFHQFRYKGRFCSSCNNTAVCVLLTLKQTARFRIFQVVRSISDLPYVRPSLFSRAVPHRHAITWFQPAILGNFWPNLGRHTPKSPPVAWLWQLIPSIYSLYRTHRCIQPQSSLPYTESFYILISSRSSDLISEMSPSFVVLLKWRARSPEEDVLSPLMLTTLVYLLHCC